MKERIQKVLANAGVESRRHIEEMVLQGRISVNGHIVTDLPVMVDPAKDRIEVDGEKIRLRASEIGPKHYIIMNKPRRVYTTNVAQGDQKLAIDLLPEGFPRVYPVGRLEAEARGLLLLTDDGELTNQLTHPKYGIVKTYHIMIEGLVEDKTLDELREGVWLIDEHTKRGFRASLSHMKVISRNTAKTVLEVTLKEAKNLGIRRILAKVGHKLQDVVRVKFGPLTLKGLAVGEWRPLTTREVKELKHAVEKQGDRGEAKAEPKKINPKGRAR